MSRSFLSVAVVTLPLASIVSWSPALPRQQGGAWDIDFDDPGRSGTVTVSVTVSYQPPTGGRQKKEITTTVDVDHNWDAEKKRRNVETKLDEAIAANQAENQSLAQTTGASDRMIVSPAGGSLNAKIEEIKIKDVKTGEDDEIDPPAQGMALAQITLYGQALGEDKSTPSLLTLSTTLGNASFSADEGTTNLELLTQARDALLVQGATVWLDLAGPSLFVLIDPESGLRALGAGCTDEGLAVSCRVLAP